MKLNPANIISAVSHAVLYLCTVLLVVAAIFVTIIRNYPNLSDIVEHKIEQRLGEILNAEITIESLDISRQRLFSQIVAQNVQITDRANPDNHWALSQASLSIDFTKSLLTRSLQVKEVGLKGLDLSILRDEAGNFHVNQVFFLPKSKMSQFNDGNNYANVHLRLLNSNIHWEDKLTDTDYAFKNIRVEVDSVFRGYHIFLSGNLPDQLGESVLLNAKITGDVKNLGDAKIDFYAKTEGFRMSEIARRFVGKSGEKVPVTIDAEIWGQVNNKEITDLRGSLSVNKIVDKPSLKGPELCLSDEYINQLSLNFSWRYDDRDWQFLAEDIEVSTSKGNWPVTQVQFELDRQSLNAKTILAYIGWMDLGAICNTLHSYSPHIVRFEDQLQQYRLNANLENLFIRFDLADNHQTSFQYSAEFNDVAFWLAQENRSIKGLSGYVEGGDAGGLMHLNSNKVSLNLPVLYPGFDFNFGINGDMQWTHFSDVHELSSDNIAIVNNDLSMNARIYAKISEDSLYTDSQFYLDSAKANAVGNYFPELDKTQTTKKWLTEAIHEGEVESATVIMRGNMRAFPFHKQSGVFQTHVNVEKGILEYKKDWPLLNDVEASVAINKDHIDITSRQATTLGSRIKKVDIEIDSFLQAVLDMKGTVDGPGQNLLQFLAESKLISQNSPLLDQISLAGDSRLNINFSRSLSRKLDLPLEVSGNIHFLGNTLDVKSVGIEVKDLAGEVQFNQHGASGEGVTATVYGQSMMLSINPAGEGASNLSFNGPFDLGLYLDQRYPRYRPFFSGVTPIEGSLHLPSFFEKNNPDKLTLNINSQLEGITSTLPSPLNKKTYQPVPAEIKFDQKQGSMSWHLDDILSLYFSIKPDQPFELHQVNLGNTEPEVISDEGLSISGAWETVDPKLWLGAYQQYIASADSQEKTNKPNLNVKFNQLELPSWPAQDIHLQGGYQDNLYVLNLDSSLGIGVIRIPDNSQPVTVNMQTLLVNNQVANKNSSESDASGEPKTAKKKPPAFIDPRKVRPILFLSKRLFFNEYKFSNVVVNTSAVEQGLVFDEIKLAAQDMTLSGTGSWLTVDDSAAKTSFNLQIDSIDIEDTLADLGFKSSVRKGQASVTSNLYWNAAPHQFDMALLYGDADFNMKDGSVSEIDPGNAGRLLALLNLGAIGRRLSLDFKDVTNKGFSFDLIKGQLNLSEGGDLHTDKITIKSSAADIKIKGSTNLIDQTYDQHITVTPAVTSTLTAAGAIVGGPIGAAAGLLADRVGSAVGLNKATNIEYKMTGTWQEPVIEKVSKKVTPAVETSGQQSGPSGPR